MSAIEELLAEAQKQGRWMSLRAYFGGVDGKGASAEVQDHTGNFRDDLTPFRRTLWQADTPENAAGIALDYIRNHPLPPTQRKEGA